MRERSNGRVSWLEFELFTPFDWLTHAISLNKTTSHEEWLKQFLPVEIKPLSLHQVHGTEICFATDQEQEGDALLSDGGEAITIRHADCQAALFVDTKERTLALVHAGWRGQTGEIYAKTVEKMKKHFNSSPSNLFVGIGPSLGPESSEFIHFESELPPRYWPYQFKPYHFDLWQLAEDQLTSLGIPKQQIEIARIDTAKDLRFHSYRRDKTALRQVTIAYTKGEEQWQ